MRTVAIHHPPFVPWLGFIESMFASDVFVLQDDVLYEKGGFQNRNKIKTAGGTRWLTIPVHADPGDWLGGVEIAGTHRPETLVRVLQLSYGKSPHFDQVMAGLDPWFGMAAPSKLIDVTVPILLKIKEMLGAPCEIVLASSVPAGTAGRLGRVQHLCRYVDAQRLYTGNGMRDFCTDAELRELGIVPVWHNYQDRHLVYRQRFMRQGFVPGLSVLDVLFNEGCEFTADAMRASAAEVQGRSTVCKKIGGIQ